MHSSLDGYVQNHHFLRSEQHPASVDPIVHRSAVMSVNHRPVSDRLFLTDWQRSRRRFPEQAATRLNRSKVDELKREGSIDLMAAVSLRAGDEVQMNRFHCEPTLQNQFPEVVFLSAVAATTSHSRLVLES